MKNGKMKGNIRIGIGIGIKFNPKSAQRLFIFVTALTFLSLLIVLFFGEKWLRYGNVGENGANHHKLYKNYFLNAERLKDMGLIVNTSHCKITDFDIFDEEILPLLSSPASFECDKYSYNWTHIDKDVLVVNIENMNKNGYQFNKEFCCYKIIRRENGPELVANKKADLSVSYSECYEIVAERTKIYAEFITVQCSWTRYTLPHYRGFHAIAAIDKNPRENIIKQKLDFWDAKRASDLRSEDEIPPNILIVGIDSTSRLNFRRNMFKTLKMLKKIESVEIFGYTKVGENTFPNFMPMFTGYEESEIRKLCLPSLMDYQDECPFIWKKFDAANYLTAHTEDSPDFTGFNFLKAGFANQPVDFYGRPLFLGAHDFGNPYTLNLVRADHLDCIGYQTNDEAITSYLESTLEFSHKNKAPIFSFSWSTTLPHSDFNMIQLSDDTYANFIGSILDKGYLNNTIFIFMGDHGYGQFRETIIGYYEDKLPNLWIKLPERIQSKFPQWQQALKINSRRLTSPYHFYWTLNHIIQTFTSTSSMQQTNVQDVQDVPKRQFSDQHFFSIVPENNSCGSVGVPDRYCACYSLTSADLNDPLLLQGATKAVEKINSDLKLNPIPNKCSSLSWIKIVAGAVMDKSFVKRYIVAFLTFPGDFLIEAEIDYYVPNATFSDEPSVQRASKINQEHVKCINDPFLELFCYCPQ